MVFLKRISLFLITNLLVVISINILLGLLSTFFHWQINPSSYMGLLILSAIVGSTGSFISLLLSKKMAQWTMGVQLIDPQSAPPRERALFQLVERLSQKAGLPNTPDVGIYESPDINAFATGPSKSHSLVAVSSGLLMRMTEEEIEGVLGHEIAHIANGDMITLTLIQGIVNTFSFFFSRLIVMVLNENSNERNRNVMSQFIIQQLLEVVFVILGSLIVRYFSRQREFRADADSARITGRDKMVAALRKLQRAYGVMEEDAQQDERGAQISAFKISNKSGRGLMELFATHPPLEQRIERLLQQ